MAKHLSHRPWGCRACWGDVCSASRRQARGRGNGSSLYTKRLSLAYLENVQHDLELGEDEHADEWGRGRRSKTGKMGSGWRSAARHVIPLTHRPSPAAHRLPLDTPPPSRCSPPALGPELREQLGQQHHLAAGPLDHLALRRRGLGHGPSEGHILLEAVAQELQKGQERDSGTPTSLAVGCIWNQC